MPPLKARGGNLIEPSRHGSACGMSDERSVYGDLGGVVWLVWPGDELHLRTPPRRRHRWIGRRQPEVLKNGLDRAVFGGPMASEWPYVFLGACVRELQRNVTYWNVSETLSSQKICTPGKKKYWAKLELGSPTINVDWTPTSSSCNTKS